MSPFALFALHTPTPTHDCVLLITLFLDFCFVLKMQCRYVHFSRRRVIRLTISTTKALVCGLLFINLIFVILWMVPLWFLWTFYCPERKLKKKRYLHTHTVITYYLQCPLYLCIYALIMEMSNKSFLRTGSSD